MQDLCAKSYKMLIKEIRENLNRQTNHVHGVNDQYSEDVNYPEIINPYQNPSNILCRYRQGDSKLYMGR